MTALMLAAAILLLPLGRRRMLGLLALGAFIAAPGLATFAAVAFCALFRRPPATSSRDSAGGDDTERRRR